MPKGVYVRTEAHNEKNRAKQLGVSPSNKGVPMSDVEKEKRRVSATGKKQSEETKNKRSKALTGRIITPEHREKIRQGCIKRWAKK
jgi:hypothetical protein